MTSNALVPVLIVGAGPAGLVLALTLRQNGIPVRIIEKEPRNRVGQRGAAIMPRSMELYNSLGILADIQKEAIPIPPMRIYQLPGGKEPITTFLLDPPVEPTPSTPYSNIIMLGQARTEAILRTHLARYNCHVELGTELRSFVHEDEGVIAHVVKKDGERDTADSIACRWLVGTDGARGAVRKLLGLSFDGETRGVHQHLVVGDVEIRGLDRKHWHSWGDMESIIVMLRATEDENVYFIFLGGHVDHAAIVADRNELARVLRAGTNRDDIELGEIKWLSEYRPSIRMVDRFGKGRVFVAGDAAHIHSPFGGQGLNSSVQDAVNLGWKLALVEKGVALPSLLDTYTEERLPVIAEVLNTSNKLFNEAIEAKRDGKTSEKAWYRGGSLNQLGVNYRWSPIVVDERVPREKAPLDPYGVHREALQPVRAGERAPDAPDLLVIRAAAASDRRSETTSLFRIFRPFHHTVLIFSDKDSEIAPVLKVLNAYPPGLVRSAIIYPKIGSSYPVETGVGHALVDQGGYAYTSYSVSNNSRVIAVVRPDGIIGGIVSGIEGLLEYFRGVMTRIV